MSKEVVSQLLDEVLKELLRKYIGNLDVSIEDICDYLVDKFDTIIRSDNMNILQDSIVYGTKMYFDKLVEEGFSREEALQIVCFSREVIQNSRKKK